MLVPYVTVTVRGSEGTLSALYSPVLQVISVPNVSLQGKKAHYLTNGWLEEGGVVGK